VRYTEAAEEAIADIRARGKKVILCGGAGLWYRALLNGVFNAPDIDEDLRQEIRNDIEEKGSVYMHQELAKVDPVSAEKLHPNDKQRIGRALEIIRQSGTSISEYQAQHRFAEKRHRIKALAYKWPVEIARERLGRRTEAMFKLGWVEEVQSLLERGVSQESPGLRCIGYREILAHLNQQMTLEETIEKTIVATRRYAKRQRNWFRNEKVEWIDPSSSTQEVLSLFEDAELWQG